MAAAMRRATRAFRRRPQDGLSLIEAAVALLLMGVAMLLTMALMAQEPVIERRLAAHHEALRLMEVQLEVLRSAAAVPAAGEIDLSELVRSTVVPPPVVVGDVSELLHSQPPAAQDLRMWAEVEALPERSLYQVTLKTRYFVGNQPFEQSLESMIWTP